MGAARRRRPVEASATAPDRPLRKDAQRNREALLAAAAEAYGERGVDASLEDIARRAGVGIGTLYRHFPTRDALNEAVYRREVESLCDGADELIADAGAGRGAARVDARRSPPTSPRSAGWRWH